MKGKAHYFFLVIFLLGILSTQTGGIGFIGTEMDSTTIKWIVNSTITDSSFPVLLNASRSYDLAIYTSWGGWGNESISKSLNHQIRHYCHWINLSESSMVGEGTVLMYINNALESNNTVTWNQTKSLNISPIRITYTRIYYPSNYPREENYLTVYADMSASLSKHFLVTHDPYEANYARRSRSFNVTSDELNVILSYLTQTSAQNWQYWVDEECTPPYSWETDVYDEIWTTIKWNDSTDTILNKFGCNYITETANQFNEILNGIFEKYLPGPPTDWPIISGGGTLPDSTSIDSTSIILVSPFTIILFLLVSLSIKRGLGRKNQK